MPEGIPEIARVPPRHALHFSLRGHLPQVVADLLTSYSAAPFAFIQKPPGHRKIHRGTPVKCSMKSTCDWKLSTMLLVGEVRRNARDESRFYSADTLIVFGKPAGASPHDYITRIWIARGSGKARRHLKRAEANSVAGGDKSNRGVCNILRRLSPMVLVKPRVSPFVTCKGCQKTKRPILRSWSLMKAAALPSLS